MFTVSLHHEKQGDMIDYVVPMVFPQDKRWHNELNRVLQYKESATNAIRYRSWGTEELLVRCIRKNLPWIRTIHIILSGSSQVQEWMDNPQIRIVFHRDFMPADILPTYNSRAIEMYLHRIPGLADCFLYGNDDMFPLSPMQESDFFRDGLPCLCWKKKKYNADKSFHRACMNGLNFVAAEFGRHYDTEWMHIGHNVVPMLRSTCEMFWQRWPKRMRESVTRFRLPQNYNQYIYSWWQILSGQYVEYEPVRSYISIDNQVNEIVAAIRTAGGLLCINDSEAVDDITNLSAIVRNEIEKRL